MNFKEFREKYNIGVNSFAELAGVGQLTLVKYEKGLPIRDDSRERIEKAMRIFELYGHNRPKCHHAFGRDMSFLASYYQSEKKDFIRRFKQLMNVEGV